MKTFFRLIKSEIILIIAIIGLVVSSLLAVDALRQNSQQAQVLYNELIAVDQKGGDVQQALNQLREYIYGHMNTKIGSENGIRPPIQLRGTYQRLVKAEADRVQKINQTIYIKAQKECEAKFPPGRLRSGRVQCVEKKVQANSQSAKQIAADLYRFDFAPPVWSADKAGFSLLAAGFFGLIAVLRIVRLLIKKWLS